MWPKTSTPSSRAIQSVFALDAFTALNVSSTKMCWEPSWSLLTTVISWRRRDINIPPSVKVSVLQVIKLMWNHWRNNEVSVYFQLHYSSVWCTSSSRLLQAIHLPILQWGYPKNRVLLQDHPKQNHQWCVNLGGHVDLGWSSRIYLGTGWHRPTIFLQIGLHESIQRSLVEIFPSSHAFYGLKTKS